MALPSYLVRSRGRWVFRYVVPKAVRARLGRVVFKHTLPTFDARTAQQWALLLAVRYAAAFNAHTPGDGPMSDDILKSALDALRSGANQWKAEKVGFSPSGQFYAKGVQTEGPEDAAQFYEMLRRLKAGVPLSTAADDAPSIPPGVRAVALREAVNEYCDIKAKSLASERARKRYPNMLADFVQFAGADTPVWQLTDVVLGDYRKKLDSVDGNAPDTQTNKFSVLIGFFAWCIKPQNYLPRDRGNPAEGQVLKSKGKKNHTRPFSLDQLKVLFQPECYAELQTDLARWLPVLALYTGARRNELAQLSLGDIREIDGVWVFDINETYEDDDDDTKSVKNKHSVRLVPIAPEIRDQVLARKERLANQGATKFFPLANFEALNGPAAAGGQAFKHYRKRRGVTAPIDKTGKERGRMGLHSFRATVITHFDAQDVEEKYATRFVGHVTVEKVKTPAPEPEHRRVYQAHRMTDPAPSSIQNLARHCFPALTWGAMGVIDLPALLPLLPLDAAPLTDIKPIPRPGRAKKAPRP